MEILETFSATEQIGCECGKEFSATVFRAINLATDPKLLNALLAEALNQVECPHCQKEFYAGTPLYIHDPETKRFVCLYPPSWQDRELPLRIEFYQELLGHSSGSVPVYVRDTKFVFGLEACAELFGLEYPAAPDGSEAAQPDPYVQELEEDDFEQVVDVESVDRRDSTLIGKWQESGQDYYAFLDEGALHIFQRHVAPEHFGDRADLFFQLHRIENFPLVVLLLVAEGRGTDNQVLYWLFNLDNRIDVQFLEHLAERFEINLHLFDHSYTRQRTMVLSPPLEQNVDYVLEEARKWMVTIDPTRRNFFIAASKFDETAYYKLGRSRPGLDARAFEDLYYPSVTKLALDILTYWSLKENYEYLIFIKSFPVNSFKSILVTVLKQAIEFGLALSEKMKRMAVEMELARSKEDLVDRLLLNFAEVVAGEKPNDMDPSTMIEIWQQLVEDAVELGVEIKPQVSDLALTIQKKLDESEKVIALDLSDDVEMLGALDQLPDTELCDLLKDKEHRVEAIRVLAESQKGEMLEDAIQAFGRMNRAEMDALGDALGGFGEMARGFIEKTIKSRRSVQVVGALRALVRLDGAKAAGKLIQELKKGRAGIWRDASELMAGLPDPPVAMIVKASRDKEPSVRVRIIPVLKALGEGEGRKRLEEIAESDPAARVRREARTALGPTEGEES